MRRKHNPTGQVNFIEDTGLSSPVSTGAMDSLLEKLRAAAPQARDQRDRRRRARLQERHQIRVASGQKVPELPEVKIDSETVDDSQSELLETTRQSIDGEEVADRAATMLQGLRGDSPGDSETLNGPNNIKVARRRESANDERRARRSRRGISTTGTPAAEVSSKGTSDDVILEDGLEEEDDFDDETGQRRVSERTPNVPTDTSLSTPTTVISPPSPDRSGSS